MTNSEIMALLFVGIPFGCVGIALIALTVLYIISLFKD